MQDRERPRAGRLGLLSHIERPQAPPAGIRAFFQDLSPTNIANAVVGFVFCATGPVAVILAVATQGNLNEAQIASWLFGAFFLNSFITIAFSLIYRQPLVFLWTIPGAVLVGPALGHLSFPEVVAAYLATGLGMLFLGFTGLVRRAMQAVPMPIVMGMVAGVFLKFGLDWIVALKNTFWLAAPMTAAFLAISLSPRIARIVPPLIAALVVGIVVSAATGDFAPKFDNLEILAGPVLVMPELSWRAIAELSVPLAITVLVVQNGQGIAVLTASDHNPPINSIAAACGFGSFVTAFVGAVSTCLTGPLSAILCSSGAKERQYAGAVVLALLTMTFGLLSPLFTRLLLAAPPAFLATLAGLAMLRVLQSSFASAFSGRYGFGALVSFLVTVSGITVLNIGAPFWGIVFGYAASRVLEPEHFRVEKTDD